MPIRFPDLHPPAAPASPVRSGGVAASAKRMSSDGESQQIHASASQPAKTGKATGKTGSDASGSKRDGSGQNMEPRWYSCALSELGHVRKINEDSFLDAQEEALWVVADGMGGHSRGDRASQAIIEAMHTFKAKDNALESVDDLLERLNSANELCRNAAQGQVMGSTVAALHLNGDNAYVLWAGDSRIYRYRQGKFLQLTDDHSLVQELRRLGELTADEAENHPSSNVITRAIGVADDVDVQVRQLDVQAGDRFLVCSDGLFKDVKPAEVEANLALPSPRQALDELVKLALRRGGTDNVTAIVVQMAIS